MRKRNNKMKGISNALTLLVFMSILLVGTWHHNVEEVNKTTDISQPKEQKAESCTISKEDASYRVPNVYVLAIPTSTQDTVIEKLEVNDVKQSFESEMLEETSVKEENTTVKEEKTEQENLAISEETDKETAEQKVSVEEETTKKEECNEATTEREYVTEPYLIDCSAYCETGNPCKDGTYPKVGETLAGKKEWLGRSCNLYYCTEDGQIGARIGTYTFHDTGFGDDKDGDGVGSIEAGTKIDLYLGDYDTCMKWGVPKVYIEFLD